MTRAVATVVAAQLEVGVQAAMAKVVVTMEAPALAERAGTGEGLRVVMVARLGVSLQSTVELVAAMVARMGVLMAVLRAMVMAVSAWARVAASVVA